MSYFERIQCSIDFIEENLTNQFSLIDVSKRACFSLYHFHRVFHCITGTSLKEYIRKRRLSEASYEILKTDNKIIDIAFRYLYETPETFSRAFKNEFGVSPINYRKNSSNGHYFKPFKLKNHTFIKGDMSMEPKIKTIPAFKVMGYKLETTSIDGKNFEEIPKFWQKLLSDECALLKKIKGVINPQISYGMCTDLKEDGSFTYVVGYEVSTFDNAEKEMHCETIPELKYAIFTAKGEMPESIQSTTKYIYGKWFPDSGFEFAGNADFELYDESRMQNPKSAECDIYIPIK